MDRTFAFGSDAGLVVESEGAFEGPGGLTTDTGGGAGAAAAGNCC